jgi:putative endonuclease
MSLLKKMLGTAGEDQAADYLIRRGYRILDRNYRTPQGEIDLIALDRDQVVFVEVKTRTNNLYGAPELAVNPQKQRRMIKAALSYIKYKKLHQVSCRFDVVAINAGAGQEVELIRNAFEMDRTNL